MESPPICLRVACDGLRLRRIVAGTGVFASPVMNVGLTDPAVNRRTLWWQMPRDRRPLIANVRSLAWYRTAARQLDVVVFVRRTAEYDQRGGGQLIEVVGEKCPPGL
jgi:hypothetical protein